MLSTHQSSTTKTADHLTSDNVLKDEHQSKKNLWIALGLVIFILLLIGAGGLFAKNKLFSNNNPTPTPKPTKKILEPINLIELRERPFINLTPKADGHNLIISINNLPKPAQSVEYELEYQTGSMLQGAFGEIDLASLPTSDEVFLGSCSAGGACTYHKDIKGGSLLTHFSGGEENYSLKSDFRYWDLTRDDEQFSSKDAKLKLTSNDLAKNKYVVIFTGAGIPDFDQLKGKIVSDIYVISTSQTIKGKVEKLSIRAKSADGTQIAYWTKANGWQYIQAENEAGKELTVANIPLAQVYLVVKK